MPKGCRKMGRCHRHVGATCADATFATAKVQNQAVRTFLRKPDRSIPYVSLLHVAVCIINKLPGACAAPLNTGAPDTKQNWLLAGCAAATTFAVCMLASAVFSQSSASQVYPPQLVTSFQPTRA